MITIQHTQEALSRAHMIALAGHAGLNISWPSHDYGIDCSARRAIKSPNGRLAETGSPVDFQLKSTIAWEFRRNAVLYDMEAKTWNDLARRTLEEPPLYVALLCLPRETGGWLNCCEERLTLQHCCYYYRHYGLADTINSSSKRVYIPRSNILDPGALARLMMDADAQAKGRP